MKALFYGSSGSGKTTLASSFPGPILLISMDGEMGTDSVSDVEDLHAVNLDSWEEVEQMYWYLEGKNEYKTVVIDTVTKMQDLAVKKVLIDKGKGTENAGNWGTMHKQDWGTMATMMKTWLDNYKELDMNVVFLAQERIFNNDTETDDDAQIDPEVGPRVSPSVGSALCASVNYIGHTFIREEMITKKKKVRGVTKRVKQKVTNYCLRVGPHSYYTTKVRKPKTIVAPAFLIDPSYDKLINIKETK